MEDVQAVPGGSPELFPYAFDAAGDRVSFIRLARRDFDRASFLDARVLTPQSAARAIPWPRLAAAIDSARLTEHCRFIFHIGHVGSTLLSRLIGGHPGAFSLREPMILRNFAQLDSEPEKLPQAWGEGGFDLRLAGCLKLLSRTFEPRQGAVIKATSLVSEIAATLLARPSAPKALMMYVAPERYLATILGGPNSRLEGRMLTPSRLRRLHRRIGTEAWQAESLSEGEALALGWACEMSALAQAAKAAGSRALRIDFDRFLLTPAPSLLSVLRHFGIEATENEVSAILAGPDMRRYSKAPEHAYDAALRAAVLDAARATHGLEIKRGLVWLDHAAANFAAVREGLMFAR